MAQQIDVPMWASKDGQKFPTEAEADAHDNQIGLDLAVSGFLSETRYKGRTLEIAHELINRFVDRFDLTAAVAQRSEADLPPPETDKADPGGES